MTWVVSDHPQFVERGRKGLGNAGDLPCRANERYRIEITGDLTIAHPISDQLDVRLGELCGDDADGRISDKNINDGNCRSAIKQGRRHGSNHRSKHRKDT